MKRVLGVFDPRFKGPAEGGQGGKGEEKGLGEVVSFNMHSPGEEEQAALSAGVPVWPL